MRSTLRILVLVAFTQAALAGAETNSSEFLKAVSSAPALAAAAQRAAAANERIAASGRLPDPEVEGMGSRMNGPMDEKSTMWEVNVRQPFPKKGERAADRERASAAFEMAKADYALMAGEMAADTAMALAEAQGAEARIRLLRTQTDRLSAVLRSLEVRLSAGSEGRIADRLTVQTRIASMELMIEEETRMAADALSEARGRLGLAPESPLPAFQAPLGTEVVPEEAAAIKLAEAKTQEANAMIKMARASANPMTSVGLRFERERTAMGNEDTIGIAFMSEIPWRSRRYARAEARAAESERDAARTDASAMRYRINAAITRLSRAEQLAATSRRLSAETLGRLNAEYDSMVRTASVGGMGQSTILEIVELLEKATETELQTIRADTAVQVARAELWRYMPVAQFQLPNS